jgi:hypothetical protein
VRFSCKEAFSRCCHCFWSPASACIGIAHRLGLPHIVEGHHPLFIFQEVPSSDS